jgi:hypothetical protein
LNLIILDKDLTKILLFIYKIKKKYGSHVNLEDLTTDKSAIDKRASNEIFNDPTKTHPSSTKLNSTKDGKLNEIFTLTKQKLQPTLNALQDKKHELLSASKISPDSSIANEYPKNSILRSTQSKSKSPVDTDALLAAIKQQRQQTKIKPFKIKQLPETNLIKTTIKDGIDSNIKYKLDKGLPDRIDNESISSIKQSYDSLPLSTPTVRNSNSCIYLKG